MVKILFKTHSVLPAHTAQCGCCSARYFPQVFVETEKQSSRRVNIHRVTANETLWLLELRYVWTKMSNLSIQTCVSPRSLFFLLWSSPEKHPGLGLASYRLSALWCWANNSMCQNSFAACRPLLPETRLMRVLNRAVNLQAQVLRRATEMGNCPWVCYCNPVIKSVLIYIKKALISGALRYGVMGLIVEWL